MQILKRVIGVLLLIISSSAWAFMPANGIWQIDSEANGDPGRGFTIDVENEVMFFTYYGYRVDGSSVFYVAAGSIVNNTFTSELLNVQGGTSLGTAYKPATLATSPGNVTLSFTSGKHGTMTLPGESPKAISKYNFGYADGPDGLLGTWLLTMTMGTTPFIARIALNTKLGATANGNGAVATSTYNYACEFQVSGTLAGEVGCVNFLSANTDTYAFKFSGDRGTGINLYGASGSERTYESHALRISTKTGAMTGLNDGTATSIQVMAADVRPLSISSSIAAPDLMTVQAKESAATNSTSTVYDPAKAAALAAWAAEVSVILSQKY